MARKRKYSKVYKISIFLILFLVYIIVLSFILFNLGLLDNFSSVKFNKDKLTYSASTIKVFDKDKNEFLQDIENIKNVSFEEIPKTVIDAFISIEDKNFYKHKGLNYKRIIGAIIKNIKTKSFVEGASTISQQLIKNTHLTNKKTLKRKFDEILLTSKMEKNMGKNEILTAYLNAIYFGSNTFGINSAAQRYFSKNVSNLSLEESATLAGIIKSPKKYSPIYQKENCLKRRNIVLKEMLKDKKISKEEYDVCIKKDLELNINKNFIGNNNYYSCAVEEACNILKTSEKDFLINNYKIYTYLDKNLQKIVENEVNNAQNISKEISKENNDLDCLATIIENNTGGINAYYGKSEYNLNNIKRQPGSTFKPIISYAPAIEYGIINSQSQILDEKYVIEGYNPKNYKDKYYGWISAKEALAKSLNIPSVKILENIGVKKAKDFAEKMGINFNEKDNNLSISLGGLTNGLKILDVANCYQTFGNNGKYIKASFIKEIRDENDNVIYSHNEAGKQVMKPSTSFLITDMLKECVNNGTSKQLKNNNIEIAAKTGTVGVNNKNNDNSDLWNISYTPEKTTCVWCGSTSKDFINKKLTGGNLPSIISRNIYQKQKFNKTKFNIPDDIKEVSLSKFDLEVNKKILLANENMPERFVIKSYFSNENLPKEYSSILNIPEISTLNFEKIENNQIFLSFEAKSYLEYKLIRENEDNKEILLDIKNKFEKVFYCDKNVKQNNSYNYTLEIDFPDFLKTTKNKNIRVKSNSVKIYLAQKNPNYVANFGF